MEAGLRRPLLPPCKAQSKGTQGRAEARRRNGIAGGRSCRPVRHSPKGTQGRAGARRGMHGEEAGRGHGRKGAPPWKRDRGRPLLPPRKAQPRGTVQGRGARRGIHGRKGAPWKRACGGRSCFPARHSPKGTQGERRAARRGRRVWERRGAA